MLPCPTVDERRYKQIGEVFGAALARPLAQRPAFLSDACEGDAEMRREVEILLQEADRVSQFLGTEQRPELIGIDLKEPPPSQLEGSVAGYEIISILGRGGMGEVYLAEQHHPKRRVALKVIRPELNIEEVLLRFQREAELLARLQHPGLAQVFEAGTLETPRGPQSYIAMQLIEGRSLAELMAESSGPCTKAQSPEILARIEKIARSLHAAHEAGVVHRDVKPQNIMVQDDGEPVVVDFGIARDLLQQSHELTQTGDQLGTPVYMSPEQVRGIPTRIDRRTDVWALGVILYELICGKRPFDRPTRFATLSAITSDALPSARSLNPKISKDLEVIIATCLERDLKRRYASAQILADDLSALQSKQPISARPAGLLLRCRRWSQRHPVLAVSLVATVLSLVVSLYLLRSEKQAVAALQAQTDALLMDDLVRRSHDLWPTLPKTLTPMISWLSEAHELSLRLKDYQTRDRDETTSKAVHKILAQAQDFEAALKGIEDRRARIDHIRQVSLVDHRQEWDDCLKHLRQVAAYTGVRLSPEVGLVPLGFDRDSGLLELWVVGTGQKPTWEGTLVSGHLRWTSDDSAAVLVLVPGGSFRMGAQSEQDTGFRFDREAEPHEAGGLAVQLTLAPFFISKYEVTQAQWRGVFGNNPSFFHPGGSNSQQPTTLRHPVEQVSWLDAQEFCRRLGLALPTESQWEYAARGGTHSPRWNEAQAIPLEQAENFADLSCQREWGARAKWVFDAKDDGHSCTAPVGSLKANPFGLHDVLGNVHEWCGSPYDDRHMVTRGSDWHSPPSRLRSAVRLPLDKHQEWGYLGFRPMRSIQPLED